MQVERKDIIWAYAARFFMISVNVILLPLILKYLSSDELGLWYVFSSISQVVNLFDFGFTSTISRHMTYAWSGADEIKRDSVAADYSQQPNKSLVVKIIITCRYVYLVISLIGLLSMMSFGTIYIRSITGNDMNNRIYFSWIVYMIAVFLNLFYGYWAALLQGAGAIAERNKMNVFSKLIQIFVTVLLLFWGMGLFGVVISYLISGLSLRMIGRWFFLKELKSIGVVFSKFAHGYNLSDIFSCFLTIWGTAWKDGVVMISQYFSTQVNTLICAYFIDLDSTSVYGLLTQVFMMISSVGLAYFGAYQPKYSSACLKNDQTKKNNIICSSCFVYKVVCLLGYFAFVIIAIPLLGLVKPEMNISFWMITLMFIFYYLYYQHNLFISIIASSNRIPAYSACAITALISFLLSILFVWHLHLGIYGLITAQLISNLAYNNWKWPLFVFSENDISYMSVYTVGSQMIHRLVTLIKEGCHVKKD